jgi:phosphatidate cytidylyltransferase
MLKQRILTAIILIAAAAAGLFLLSTPQLAAVSAVLTLLGAWEWSCLAGWCNKPARAMYTALMALALAASYMILEHAVYPLTLACAWWVLALYWIIQYQRGHSCLPLSRAAKALPGLLVLVPAWLALLMLHQHIGAVAVLFLLALIWCADTGAYFAGRRWGQAKLVDKVSPGKTWAGVYGALAASGALALAYVMYQGMGWSKGSAFLLLCLLTVLFSIVGDLLESLFKRCAGIKDSGKLFPGHGGVLDRIDSLTAALPVFALGVILGGH